MRSLYSCIGVGQAGFSSSSSTVWQHPGAYLRPNVLQVHYRCSYHFTTLILSCIVRETRCSRKAHGQLRGFEILVTWHDCSDEHPAPSLHTSLKCKRGIEGRPHFVLLVDICLTESASPGSLSTGLPTVYCLRKSGRQTLDKLLILQGVRRTWEYGAPVLKYMRCHDRISYANNSFRASS